MVSYARMNPAQEDLLEHGWQRSGALAPSPLASRMRPRSIAAFVGQQHLLGPGRPLRVLLDKRWFPSMILWGPPGVGKTTLAQILARETEQAFAELSATSAGIKDVRQLLEQARGRRRRGQGTILFIDEIHRWSRTQQDALLPHVESGLCTLVGATTENPSFEVNAALLSRVRVFELRPLAVADLVGLMRRVLGDPDGLAAGDIQVEDGLLAALAHTTNGDARQTLGLLEVAVSLLPEGSRELTPEVASLAVGGRTLRHDRAGEAHYNVVSALIKSMRASDPDAAVYWLTRMLEAGEDLNFISRRLLIFASEDIGNADPQALVVASAAAQAAHQIGRPEAVLPLTQATIYLALAPKSNTALTSYAEARKLVGRHGSLEVPRVVRNAVTELMKQADYGVGYRYPHDFEGGVVPGRESYLPDKIAGQSIVQVSERGWEAEAMTHLMRLKSTDDSPDKAR